MIPLLYRGSVKDLIGPIETHLTPSAIKETKVVLFDYTDAFSVFDWGRMPDVLPRKGEALAVLAAETFEKLEKPESWREFSKSPQALALRKANRFGAAFNEIGEELGTYGLRTHYVGVLENLPTDVSQMKIKKLSDVHAPVRRLVVRHVSAVKPQLTSVLGRALPDYMGTRNSPLPRLIPLEVVFRMSCPPGSSLVDRVNRDPNYLASLGFPDVSVQEGSQWEFPILELFTKLEPTDRPLSLSEALAISGLSAQQLQEVLLKTAWVASFLKHWCARLGIELADGKLEWALDEDGKCFLVDAIGPDEVRLLKEGVQLSKEFLREFYRTSAWYRSVEQAKSKAAKMGSFDWKKAVPEVPPALPASHREWAIQVYLSLANELSGRKWFADADGLAHVVRELKLLKARSTP